jgi:putative ABC transport system permease protein
MSRVALQMLLGDRAKYFGLVFAIAFASLLMSHQVSIFAAIMHRTKAQVEDVTDAEVWVMEPRVLHFDENEPMRDAALPLVRGVEGIAWAAPLTKSLVKVKTERGELRMANMLGHDDASLAGVPRDMVLGSVEDLRRPGAVLIDDCGYQFLFPGEPLRLGRTLEMNDRRAEIVGICRVNPPFQTTPLLYARRSEALNFSTNARKTLAFVIAKPDAGIAPEEAARRVEAATGLKARSRTEFGRMSLSYYLRNTGIPINFGITISMALVVGAVIAGQTFYIFTVENLKQFGALKAIGVTDRRISGMILLQALVVAAIGIGLGAGLCGLFFAATADVPHLRGITLTGPVLGLVSACVVAVVAAASLVSVRRVRLLEPAVVFRG